MIEYIHPPLDQLSNEQAAEAMRAWILRDGKRATGLREVLPSGKEGRLIAGLIWHASTIVIDQLFDDMETLLKPEHRGGGPVLWVIDSLPPRYSDQYTGGFAKKFIVATVEVTSRFHTGWAPLGSTAEELAMRLILEQAEASADLWGVPVPSDWMTTVFDCTYEDLDHEDLFAEHQLMTDPDVDVDEWFINFRGRSVGPFHAADIRRPE